MFHIKYKMIARIPFYHFIVLHFMRLPNVLNTHRFRKTISYVKSPTAPRLSILNRTLRCDRKIETVHEGAVVFLSNYPHQTPFSHLLVSDFATFTIFWEFPFPPTPRRRGRTSVATFSTIKLKRKKNLILKIILIIQ